MKVLKNIIGLNSYISLREKYRALKSLIKKIIGKQSIDKAFDAVKNKRLKPIDKSITFGVNIIGYVNSESGIGEMSRSIIRSIQRSKIPYTVYNFDIGWHRTADKAYDNFSTELPYLVNIFCFNAEETPYRLAQLGYEKLKGKYNIGFWAWELENFPSKWNYGFEYVDEIWTISKFSKQAIAKSTNLPVSVVPLIVEFQLDKKYDRQYFDLDPNEFIFFFSFDGFSFADRKNPFVIAKAFAKSFKNKRKVLLLIKCHNLDWFHRCKLDWILKGTNYKIIDDYLARDEFLGLLSCIDTYVSLHRSEGFGYGMAEAMYLGKKVIATGYSGNLDFMTQENSYLVPYDLVKINKTIGPYQKGNCWADVNINKASEIMLKAFNDDSSKKTRQAAVDIRSKYSLKLVSQDLKTKITELKDLLRNK